MTWTPAVAVRAAHSTADALVPPTLSQLPSCVSYTETPDFGLASNATSGVAREPLHVDVFWLYAGNAACAAEALS